MPLVDQVRKTYGSLKEASLAWAETTLNPKNTKLKNGTPKKHPTGIEALPVSRYVGAQAAEGGWDNVRHEMRGGTTEEAKPNDRAQDPVGQVKAQIQLAMRTKGGLNNQQDEEAYHTMMEDLAYLRLRQSGKYTMQSDCLVDTWISRGIP